METDRYLRHSLIDWFSQDAVKASKFAVIGCGAVGNEVSKNLTLLGVGQIDLFDFDTIEIHNLTRSVLFREFDIGESKSGIAAKRLRELDPNVEIQSYHGDFWEHLPLSQIVNYDCIICCVDNFEARIRLNQLCKLAGTNLVNTGIDSKFAQIELYPFRETPDTACYECNLPLSAYDRIQQRYSCGWLKKVSFVERKIPTTIITSSLAASLATSLALELIRNTGIYEAHRMLINSTSGLSTVSELGKNQACPGCTHLGNTITVIKGSREITPSIKTLSNNPDDTFVTSEPILVSTRCTKCTPNSSGRTIVFRNAGDFDASIGVCEQCGEETIEVIIRDIFKVSEMEEQFLGLQFPCKYLLYSSGENTVVIDME